MLKSNPRLRIGIVILAVFTLSSLILPLLASENPSLQGTYFRNLPISWKHPLGTNALGQDIFWFLIFAIRNSLVLGISVSLCVGVISALTGLTGGYLGGWADRLLMLITDSFITLPVLPVLIVLGALVRGKASFLTVGAILVAFGWAMGARTIRSIALTIREREFINMAWFSGAKWYGIILKEVFPYVYPYGVVGFINTILYAINTEAALAIIGLSKVEIPTLGSIIFWALNYNALLTGHYVWVLAPVVATVLLFLGLFLTSTGYNQLSAARRGHS